MLLKSSLVLALSLAETATAVALKHRAICNADYCLRALRASQIPTRLPQASADCSLFLGLSGEQHVTATITSEITITSSVIITLGATETSDLTVTQTTTVAAETITVTNPLPAAPTLKKRQVVTIPEYASWCSGSIRYTSACACIGVTSVGGEAPCSHTETVSTTVIAPFTETIYTTATETRMLNATATSTPEQVVKSVYQFKIRGEGGGNTVYLSVTGPGTIDIMDDISEATVFTLSTTSGPLMVGDLEALSTGDGTQLAIINIENPNEAGPDYHPLECTLGSENKLECSYLESTQFSDAFGFLAIGPSAGLGEFDLTLTAFAG